MTQSLQIFMEYRIKSQMVNEYEQAMEHIIAELPNFEATQIQWFVATDQEHLYVEMCKVPTEAHYVALKKLRRDEEHHLFSKIHSMVEGGKEKIHCWAFRAKKEV